MKKIILLLALFSLGFNVPPPSGKTSTDVFLFLAEDQTDKIPYSPNFNCVQFSDTVINNARGQGFIVSGVAITWADTDYRHKFVAFYTTDRGIIWIEPQEDSEYRVMDYSVGMIPQGGDILCRVDGPCVNPRNSVIRIEYLY